MQNEFEFLRFVTIGQYLPTGSVIHRLDPRTRLIATVLFLAAITFTVQRWGLGLALVTVLVTLGLARIPLSYALRGLLPPLPFLLILGLLQVFFSPQANQSPALFQAGPVAITGAGLWAGAALLLRFASLILGLSLASACLSTTEMVRGLEALLRPLTRLGLPTHEVVLVIQVTLRFLPFLAQAAERIAKAQASRGADWGTGRGGLLRRVRQALPLIVPLFLTGLRRAENLALAMEARGYSGGQGRRTSMVELHFHAADGLALALVVGVAAGILWL